MNKRFQFKIIMAAVAILILAACGGSPQANESTSADNQTTATDAAAPLNLPDSVDVQTVAEVKDRDDVIVFDVREQNEYDSGHIPGVVHIPMGQIPNRLDEIPTDQTVILTCRSGNRSGQVTNFLRENGFTNVHNMDGGIVAWQSAGLPVEQ